MADTETKTPASLKIDDMVFSVAFHPERQILATGDIEGQLALYSYQPDDSPLQLKHRSTCHKKPCRCVAFTLDGDHLLSASKAGRVKVMDVETNKIINNRKAHTKAIYSMKVVDAYLVATGDEDGNVKVWDFRANNEILTSKDMEEYVSALDVGPDKRTILATSGEGTLSAYNLGSRKLELQSELFDSEFLSLAVMKNGRKVVIGSGDGALNVFNWSEWGNISDRFPGHPSAVDSMVAISEHVICTGCIDGCVRAVHCLPNRFVGIVGEHEGESVECLAVSSDQCLLASYGQDSYLRFWDVGSLHDLNIESKSKAKSTDKSRYLPTAPSFSDFFSGLADV